MKKNSAFAFLALACSATFMRVAIASEAVPATVPVAPSMAATIAVPGAQPVTPTGTASPWADKGLLSTDAIIGILGITVTPEQRAQIDRAAAERNAALQAANAQFSKAIYGALKTDDAALTKQMADEKERRRMEQMRKWQPSRYEALKRKQKG